MSALLNRIKFLVEYPEVGFQHFDSREAQEFFDEFEKLSSEVEEFRSIVLDYFQNDREGWKRPWLEWRDLAAKLVGLPTSKELHS